MSKELCMEDPPGQKELLKKHIYIYIQYICFSVQNMLMMQPAAGSIIQLDG